MEAYIIDILEREQQPPDRRLPACLPAPEHPCEPDSYGENEREAPKNPIIIDLR
jgi:hypothetical protein